MGTVDEGVGEGGIFEEGAWEEDCEGDGVGCLSCFFIYLV